jgi:hypothetical protein
MTIVVPMGGAVVQVGRPEAGVSHLLPAGYLPAALMAVDGSLRSRAHAP